MTITPIKTDEQQTTPSRVKDTGVPKVQAQGGEASDTPGKRKEISPLQPEDQNKRNMKRRMKPNHLEPVNSEMETVLQEPVQETKDPEWQKVETRKTKKKKNRETIAGSQEAPREADDAGELVKRTSTRSHEAYCQVIQMLAIWPHLE